MSDFLLDTTVFVDLYRGDPAARAILDDLIAGRLQGSFSPISVLELWMGQMSAGEERFHRSVLALLEEAPVTSIIAERAGVLLGSLSGSIRETIIRDAVIAAAGDIRGEPVVTRNTRDFERLQVAVRAY